MNISLYLKKINYPLIINVVVALTIFINLVMVPVFVGLDYDISGVESNVVFTMQSILQDNATLYDNPELPPFSVTQYSPLYYMLADGVLTALNVSPGDDLLIRVIGRSISLGLCLLLFALLYSMIRKQVNGTGRQALVLGFAIVAFAVPWYYLTRPDVLVALFYLMFILATYRYIDRGGFMPAFWMGVLAVLAFSAKQNGIFLTGIGGLFFLYYKDFKGIFYAFIGFAVAAGLFMLLYSWQGYEAEYFLKNAFDGVNNGLGVRSFVEKTILAFLNTYGFYLVGTIYVIYELCRQKEKMSKKLFFTVWFTVLIFLFATLTATKKGSSVNYYNEFLLASLLLWGFYFQLQKSMGLAQKVLHRAVLFVAFASFFASIHHMHQYFFTNLKEWVDQDKELEEVVDVVQENIGEDYFYSTIRQLNIRLPENTIFPQFDIVECCAFPRGIYKYGELCKLIENGNVKFLIFDSQPPLSIYGCTIEGAYRKYRQIGRYNIYENVNAKDPVTGSISSN